MREAKALARLPIAELRIYEDLPEPSLHADHDGPIIMFNYFSVYRSQYDFFNIGFVFFGNFRWV